MASLACGQGLVFWGGARDDLDAVALWHRVLMSFGVVEVIISHFYVSASVHLVIVLCACECICAMVIFITAVLRG